jgi:hypothetical protein
MKQVLMIVVLVVSVSLQAQPPGHGKEGPRKEGHRKSMHDKMEQLSPQQKAQLKTKEMTLHLDLTEAQQTEILKLNLETATKREQNKPDMKEKREISANEMFERANSRLDDKIATKKKLKSVLTKEQFEKFEKAQHRKDRDHRHRLGRKKR